ncbi:SDR family NAD(P)-dependent oxidoreductase [Parerythrobacter jejuensis]|uniref:SDR family oxidoreductase n=1 Tax=Parerythrobacter jejuensis TaxID=795812 RepID=A0A845AHW1_9SPHN|nr:SDR family oxidoreductase [Parerythrobacter jejuensis]MXP30232.1 SDR family oxidoreductase [Parerythrobacter jejuensis]MXP32992.1 SDR family oxidoreductase [Parerythrobacter jejuensis]
MARLDGKTAVILGAASAGNMGQVIARLFASEGATVMVAGRHEGPLKSLAEEIGGHYAICDITDRGQVQAMAAKAKADMGRVDAAINCTGWGLLASLVETTEEQLDQIVDLQFKGTHHFLQAFVEQMIAQEPSGGSLISLSSATTKALINNHAAYIGTKRGTEALIECVANDYGPQGIKANTVSPAFTESPMTADSFQVPGLVDAFLPKYPMGRLNTSEDVANACLWLCTDEAFLTGQNIQPNGGVTLRGNPQATDIERSVGAAMAAQAGDG